MNKFLIFFVFFFYFEATLAKRVVMHPTCEVKVNYIYNLVNFDEDIDEYKVIENYNSKFQRLSQEPVAALMRKGFTPVSSESSEVILSPEAFLPRSLVKYGLDEVLPLMEMYVQINIVSKKGKSTYVF